MLHPASKLGKSILWFGGLALILQLWRLISGSRSGSMLSVWAAIITYVFVVCLILRAMRWSRQKLMWRLRNRLIVTYVFIGVIPIVLVFSMVLLAGYIFAGQFATYIVLSDLDTELQHLNSANVSLSDQFRHLAQGGKLTPQLASEIASSSDENFRQRSVTVLEGDKGFVIESGGKFTDVQMKLPDVIKGDTNSFVMEHGRLQLRAVKRVEAGARHLIVLSNLPITSELLQRAARVGSIDLYPPDKNGDVRVQNQSPFSSERPPSAGESSATHLAAGGSLGNTPSNAPQVIEAGKIEQAANSIDPVFRWGTPFSVVDWDTGKELTGVILVATRPSMLYNVLFGSLNAKGVIFIQVLIGIAIFFGLIELIALFIGVRLTRTMTKSVTELYTATQHVNRGDLSHRIQVKTKDQMASLEESFNSMSASLSNLIAEQKEKQRLEGELTIAHEVQELLFPRQISELSTLEVHGVCRPARTVSGDYYDFIPLLDERMMLAVGDISGKGISAALLMATVHAFVRAYSLEPDLALAAVTVGGEPSGDLQLYYRGDGNRDSRLSPGMLMATLNYQLYRSTPPEKYATMFLGSYDAGAGLLTYSNAGHLPPYVIAKDGGVTQLDTSGTVVGLFDGMSYEESRIAMHPGDIFVAFSDGVTEPENEFGEFGEERLVELIQVHRDQSLSRISELVTGAVADWIGGNEQPDDVTLVLARAR
jgi:sigma-B regulation protein RsbU (phosphoserine phosphatase)